MVEHDWTAQGGKWPFCEHPRSYDNCHQIMMLYSFHRHAIIFAVLLVLCSPYSYYDSIILKFYFDTIVPSSSLWLQVLNGENGSSFKSEIMGRALD